MKHIVELKRLFSKHLNWHGSRITFLALFIISIMQTRTVNLSKIANGFATKGTRIGKIRRVEDFFRKFKMDYDEIAKLLSSFIENINKWVLIMDRTNWKIGEININILYIAVAYKSVSIPIMWSLLEKKDENGEVYTKKGNSNTDERKKIVNRFIKIFGIERIEVLTANREFIGKEWFKYLKDNKIRFCIRIKQDTPISHKGKDYIQVKTLFQNLKLNEYINVGIVNMNGVEVCLTGGKIKNDYLIIVTDIELGDGEALSIYAKRWEIETMFKAFKSKGFNLEDTHLTKKDRIEKLLALMAIAFVWSYIAGEYYNEIEPIKLKKKQI